MSDLSVEVVSNEIAVTVAGVVDRVSTSFSLTGLVFVDAAADFPAAVAGVRTLPAGTAYYVTTDVDLAGDRLVCASGGVAIIGTSSETASLTSTGLGASTPLITAPGTLRMRDITISGVGTGFALGTSGGTGAYDWDAVNFSGVTTVGTIGECGNVVIINSAWLSSAGLTVTGPVGTVAFSDCLLLGTSSGTLITLPASAEVTRRVRLRGCAVIVPTGGTGLDVSASATIPDESYILDTVAFSGGGTYLAGLDYTSNKADFMRCDGITNTAVAAAYNMINNGTATVIASAGVAVKAAGTTTPNAANQKFSHTTNRLTYTGARTDTFVVSAVATLIAGNNQKMGLYVAKNGATLSTSEMYATTSGNGRAEAIGIQDVIVLDPNDYIEIWIENDAGTQNITVEYLNVQIREV